MICIDLTTRNTVYNTLGAQAQWIQHRFGKRKYPLLDLDKDAAINVLHQFSDSISFISVYGDPCLHPNFSEILASVPIGRSIVNTTLNFDNDAVIESLNNSKSYVVVPLYGFQDLCDKIILYSDWSTIDKNLKKLTCGVCIEFYTFQHNVHQIDQVIKYCNEINVDFKIKKGVSLHPDGFSPIVDEEGNWLYDAYPCSENSIGKWQDLHKTTNGYNSLIQFIKPMSSGSIIDLPYVFPTDETFSYDNNLSISVTGDVFPSYELHQIFTNALCNDWNLSLENIVGLDKITVREDFKYICSSISKIYQILRLENNIYKKKILTNFTDSNV